MLTRFQSFAKSKISQFNFTITKQNILRFNISVHNIESIQDFKGFKQLSKDDQSLLFRKSSFFFDSIIKITTITVFIDEIVVVSSLEVILVFDYVFARTDGR